MELSDNVKVNINRHEAGAGLIMPAGAGLIMPAGAGLIMPVGA